VTRKSLNKGGNESLEDKVFTYLMVCSNFDYSSSEAIYYDLLKKFDNNFREVGIIDLFLLATKKLDQIFGNHDFNFPKQDELPISKVAGRKVEQEKIKKALFQLKLSDRILVTLKYLLDFTYLQISEITGRKEGALRTSLSRSVKRFIAFYRLSSSRSKASNSGVTLTKKLLNKIIYYHAPVCSDENDPDEIFIDKNQQKLIELPHSKTSLINIIMNIIKRYVLFIIIFVTVIVGILYLATNYHLYYLKKTDYLLDKIEEIYQPESVVDPLKKADLISGAILHLDSAIESVEHIHKPIPLLKALKNIADHQQRVNNLFGRGLWSEELRPYLGDSLDTLECLIDRKELVKQAMLFVGQEIEDGETDVNIDIDTSDSCK